MVITLVNIYIEFLFEFNIQTIDVWYITLTNISYTSMQVAITNYRWTFEKLYEELVPEISVFVKDTIQEVACQYACRHAELVNKIPLESST